MKESFSITISSVLLVLPLSALLILSFMSTSHCSESKVNGMDSAKMDTGKIDVTKEDAVALAKEMAKSEGYEVDQYQIEVQDKGDSWFINFRKDAPYRGGDQHFGIFVDKSCKTEVRLFRGM